MAQERKTNELNNNAVTSETGGDSEPNDTNVATDGNEQNTTSGDGNDEKTPDKPAASCELVLFDFVLFLGGKVVFLFFFYIILF